MKRKLEKQKTDFYFEDWLVLGIRMEEEGCQHCVNHNFL